jgi:hypothetical protein
MQWAGYVAYMGAKVIAYRILVEKPETIRNTHTRWKDSIKWILEKWDDMDWINGTQDRDQWPVLGSKAMDNANFLSDRAAGGF